MAASEAPLACVAEEPPCAFWAWNCHPPVSGSSGILSARSHLGPFPAASPSGEAGQLRGEPAGPAGSLSLTPLGAPWRGKWACGKQNSAPCMRRWTPSSSALEGNREWSCRSW